MSIRISHVWPKIGIQTQKAKLNLKNNGKTDHIISHTNPQIEINSTNAKVHIDQSQCFADAGLKNIEAFATENVQLAQKNVMEYIQKKVQLGDNCAKTYNKEARPILDSIRNEMSKTIDYNIGLMQNMRQWLLLRRKLDIQVNEGKLMCIIIMFQWYRIHSCSKFKDLYGATGSIVLNMLEIMWYESVGKSKQSYSFVFS